MSQASSSGRASPVATSRPRVSAADAGALARGLWGVEPSRPAEELPSERDRNFRIRGRSGTFVLKVAGATESDAVLDLQNRALTWLAERDPELPVPRVVPTPRGEEVARADTPDGPARVRLLTWLPGSMLADARPRDAALLSSVGGLLGRLDAALAGFSHPAARDRDLLWNPERSAEIARRALGHVGDAHPERAALVESFLGDHARIVAPLWRTLPWGVIHNDANEHNVLVGPPALRARVACGLLDFGDMVEAPLVCEAAVAVAYGVFGHADPAAAACAIVSGYDAARRLEDAELEALWTLAAIRLCASVCIAAERRGADAQDPYLYVSEAPAWEALARMREIHPRLARYRLRAACGRVPCPRGAEAAAWLASRAKAELGRVVDADLSRAEIFDLSVGSPVFETPADATDTARMTERLFGRMRESGAPAGIGRYDEARLIYATDAFAGAGGEHPERRTVHLAIDVFVAPGSSVYAPLAGRVHAARDNAERLDYGPTVILEHAAAGAPVFYTLYGHLSPESLDGLAPGRPVAKGERIGAVGAPPRNGDWAPHVHFQVIADLLDRDGEFPGVSRASEREVWTSICPDPNLILGIPPERLGSPRASAREMLAQRRRRLGPSLSLSYRTPLSIARGFGTTLYDDTGREFLDMVNNVAHVGHCHPRVVEAGRRQMAVLNTNTRYLHPSIVRYAGRLAATLPEPLSVCFFVCSGSEANELALRMARARTGGRGVVVVGGAYHGNTQALVDVSPYKFDGPGGAGRPPHVAVAPMPDDYRGLYRRDDPRRGERFAAHVGEAFASLRAAGHAPAAFLCESLLSCGGQIVLPPGYLAEAHRLARAAGAVCIADEVQVGFGRVGDAFWGFETQGVFPDIVTMGKPIGNGHPLAAVVTTPEVAAAFANGMEYFNTFGGNPVSCEIGLAVLDVVRDEGLRERARRTGGRLRDGLEALARRHACVGDVRGLGLFLGIELVSDRDARTPDAEAASYVVERMRDHGILLSTDGPDHDVIKMKPPLSFSDADADRVLAAYDRVLGEDFLRCR
jgi:4-aminobutyrate aminotransferase-like enzyme/Ser/Thr protein kinase RdoA (MazF antagonist)